MINIVKPLRESQGVDEKLVINHLNFYCITTIKMEVILIINEKLSPLKDSIFTRIIND